jgi:hypothetical protein
VANIVREFMVEAGHAFRKIVIATAASESAVQASPSITAGAGAASASDNDGSFWLRSNGVPEVRISSAWEALAVVGQTPDFEATGIKADVIAESTSAAGVTIDGVLIKDSAVSGLRAVSATAAAITGATTLAAADSGGVFSLAKTSAYAVTLPTPSQGMTFKFLVIDTGSFAVTFSDGSAHLYGQINEAGTIPIAMTGTTLTGASGQSVGDWICFEGIDATHYLVTGSAIVASKWTIA